MPRSTWRLIPTMRRGSIGCRRCSTSSSCSTDGGSKSGSSWSSPGWGCPPIVRSASCRAAGAGARCSPRRWSRIPTCCCSTSRPTISTSRRSNGSRSSSASSAARCCSSPTIGRFSAISPHGSWTWIAAALTSWPGSYTTYLEKKAAALETEERDLDRLDKKLAQEEAWLRQGVKARRTRNEGRVKALLALRAERAARRAQIGNVADGHRRLVDDREDGLRGRRASARRTAGRR